MVKVFLVEDEIVMREGIKNNIPWEKEGLEFVGDASDGELAFPMIKQSSPDIVITDIKMPFMDGLELSRLIKKEMPWIKIIILSGYDEFSYAKEAITIGVTDYLLKPISSAKLLEEIKSAAAKIEEEKRQKALLEQFRREMHENEQMEKQRLFNDIISNKMSLSEIVERADRLSLNLVAPVYNILLFQMRLGEGDIETYSEDIVEISSTIREYFKNNASVDAFERGVEGWAFLIKGDKEETLASALDMCISALETSVREFPQIYYFGGIGNRVNRLSGLPECYDQANRAFAYRYMERKSQFLYYENINNNRIFDESDLDLKSLDIGKIDRKILTNFLKYGLKEEVHHFIEDYFNGFGENNMNSLFFRQYITMDLYFATLAFIEDLGYSSEIIVEHCGDFRQVASVLSSVESTKCYLNKIITVAIGLRDSASAKKYGSIIDEAKEYIRNHYDKDDISLNTVAASVNISPSHFSTIFSQEAGKTFIEFLTGVRMEKAKELLMCSNMKSAEIGYAVGYKDSHYFSYLFKKTQECTPREFRARGKSDE